MSANFSIEQVLLIIFLVRMSHEGNLMTIDGTQGGESGGEAFSCLHGSPGQELGPRGRYGSRLAGTRRNLKVRETNGEGRDEDFDFGFENPYGEPFSPGAKLTDKTGNETKIVHKRQKIFFRKNFAGGKGPGDGKKIISLLGLFDLTRPKNDTKNLKFEERYEERAEGESEIWVAKLAVKHVNERKLFGGYQLRLYFNDTKCDSGVAVDALFHALFLRTTPLPILLGPACSMATASLASITPYWNIVQISFGATSPVLSNRKKFPMFYRMAAPESSHNGAKLAFIKQFGWNTVTFISQNEKEYILSVNYFIKVLERENITCKGTVTFGKNNFQDQLKQLKEMDTRIIFGSFSEEIAPKIFCQVFELGVYGTNYAWILQGNLNRKWWKNPSECSEKNLKRALQGVFFISSYHNPDQPHFFHPNFTSKDLNRELSQRKIPISRYVHETYDAIWTAAIALNETLRNWSQSKSGLEIEDFNYDRSDMAQTIFHKISLINSVGMSGPISFEGADRLGVTAFHQFQGNDLAIVAIYFPADGFLNFSCGYCRDVFWEGGQVPVSQRFLLRRIETISFNAFLAVSCSTSVAIVLAVLFLIFNSYFRKLKNIKLSSPKLNNIAVAGCIAVYIGVFLLGLDYATLPNVNYYSIICTAKVYFFAAGFSLAFGSIFAKTYRVHKIFIKSQGGFIKKKFLQDRQLILLVGVLLLIDGLILTFWVVLDPLQRHLHNATLEFSTINRSVMYQNQIEICSCKHMNGWLSFLYMYKGLQLLMGVFLAWETRHVKVPGLNDSQYIVLSVYSVVITSCIVVVLANLIFEKPTIAYLIISTMILSSTTATLCSLFFPKVKIIFSKSVDNFDPIMQSMGLILESKTRRFVVDEAKEKLYRLEVQNRVYKREVFTLGNEISRLEKQLMSIVSSPLTNSFQTNKVAGTSNNLIYHSLLEISSASDFSKRDLPVRFLTQSWPGEIHTISTFSDSLPLQTGLRTETLKKNSLTKCVCGKERMKNFLKITINPAKKKDQSEVPKYLGKKNQKDQKKFVLSQYLPYVQKTIQNVKSIEDLRDFSVWRIDGERLTEDKSKARRKSQPSSRMRFKGSPRFPHRIVPSSFFMPEMDKDSRAFEEFNGNTGNVIIHEVEPAAESSSVEGDKIE